MSRRLVVAYEADVGACGAGYALMRYARRGLLAAAPGVTDAVFDAAAALLPTLLDDADGEAQVLGAARYAFLRLARQGAFGFAPAMISSMAATEAAHETASGRKAA